MFCKNCGSEIEEGIKFCPSCGTAVEEPSGDTVQEEAGTAYPVSAVEEAGTGESAGEESSYRESGSQDNYGGQEYAGPDYGQGAAVLSGGTNRNIALCIIFSIITCGIYGIYWMYVLNEELNAISGDVNATSGGMVILFTFLTCGIYSWYWYYKMGEKVDYIRGKQGLQPGSYPVLFLILGIFGLGIVNYALMQDSINKIAA